MPEVERPRALSMDAYKWSQKVGMQGCIKSVTQSRYARMHKDSHTKPLHDATAQMAVDAQMHRPPMTANARMRDSACPKFRTDAKPTDQARFDNPTPSHFHPLNEWGYYFWCGG